ncbi:glycerol dehydrogenase [Corynebacterium sanguinis]|uniref:Glycerol dehydrogenase n=1 Tax=Corynebacterium sanguinis TaxID=2594913 RepID=A0A6I7R745_9CORY|nr:MULTISPECIES: glycerol dehydrogenase [Corynebacterium]MBA4503761.1 glycerol dehydrogenase [Corynebacterium sanguinis]MCT1499359.1 glycerol dehydrogenase [Corynebacterium sanguinis]MCT1555667.1 glycerol dehydrogenase [Corynebacterium sanguinis]MCT1584984.1 glycerol dehydrogenase [Corynebacterium sanguinis]MCT1597938.1 glycerol dehydrogenase [Corynebacterium sanguinis]
MTVSHTQDKMYTGPSRYVQGIDLIDRAAHYLKPLGSAPLIIADEVVWDIAGQKLQDSLRGDGMEATHEVFGGEASLNEIGRIVEKAQAGETDVIIGLGGGKTIDSARAVADKLSLPVAIFPTAVSADAPTARVSVIYTDEGVFDSYLFYDRNPDLVAVDTRVIANAPVNTLRSGLGDALATLVEARAVHRANGRRMDDSSRPTLAGLALAEKCEETLFAYAHQALKDAEEHIVSPALEAICEANTLLSGLGFENGGLAAVHAIHNGFTALDGDIHHMSHGEKVAFGIGVQLMLTGATREEADRYFGFLQSVGLPTTLEEIHLADATDDDLYKIAELACSSEETLKQMPGEHTPTDVVQAIRAADRYARSLRERA